MSKRCTPLASLAAALAIGLSVGWWLPRGAVVSPTIPDVGRLTPTSTASILVDYGDGRVVTYAELPVTAGQTVWELMKELEQRRDMTLDVQDFGGDLGMLLTGIGGVNNDARHNRFWHYWVNNRFAEVGVSTRRIQPGDQVMWKYTSNQFKAEEK